MKSSVGIVGSQAKGGFQSAHHGTSKNSKYLGVLVRIRYSYFSCKAGNALQLSCTIPPLGIVKREQLNRHFFFTGASRRVEFRMNVNSDAT